MSLWNSLSQQQQRIALHLMKGDLDRSQMAEVMEITSKTVDSHRLSALANLGLANNTQLVHFGLRNGLIEVSKH